ncbi:SHOCT domain-containing protein [Ramlibacter sp. AW1]|uniref:SHOCT domain-containing protein n=1 Tax=Ramlibacter aurantiacus TaxID=2801330 RepID=A0A937D4P6_9BURK|nr:SHOCT domain-containing protein [Ramlibacter aurantiacus]MBL0419108.1 SHOCT domain-containing protein [Ramlibacter aurantiacus]
MMWDFWEGGAGMAWFGLAHVLWWVLLVAGVVALVRLLWPSTRGKDRADEILRERFARGEIDQGEFEQRMRSLNR